MTNKQFFQIKMHYLVMGLLPLILLLLAACSGSGQSTAQPETVTVVETVIVEREVEVELVKEVSADESIAEEPAAEEAAQAEPTAAAQPSVDGGLAPVSNRPNASKRLIIKNADIELIAGDTDAFVNRSLGVVTEYQGYIISNRTWFKDDLKYATLTIGVPAENFEELLGRLKNFAVRITNESVSGQDVTDEFVDLGSRLRNLEATADRIREFLEQAKDVDQSLEVSAQLSEIEAQIEQVKGRMTYLRDRASFSTITLQISPQVIAPTSTPTFTPMPTATPRPTATPVVWSASTTFNRAQTMTNKTATSIFQFTVDLAIWVIIVILPFTLPFIIVVWVGVRWIRRMGFNNILRRSSTIDG